MTDSRARATEAVEPPETPQEDLEASDEERPDFCAVTRDEIEPRLRDHARWLDSGGGKGARLAMPDADLRRIDLKGARLQRANLRGADLDRADLEGADLRRADLRDGNLRNAELSGANLRKARLDGANLTRARLRGADLSRVQGLETASLQDSDLSDASGLLGTEFAGLDITGTRLPGDIARFDGLSQIADLSRQTRALFLTVIAACVFSWLTIATTTDLALITNSASTPLPIIQTKVPIAGFYWAAPALLLILYLYLHLSMQSLWEEFAELPAIFPDGRSLAQRAYPWMLSNLLHAHMPLLRPRRPAFLQLKVAITLLAGWVLVPLTLFVFWARYLPRHEMAMSLSQFLAVMIAVVGGGLLYLRARATLRGRYRDRPGGAAVRSRSGRLAFLLLAVLLVGISYAVCDAAIRGDPRQEMADRERAGGLRSWVPRGLAALGYRNYADLAEARLSSGAAAGPQAEEASREALANIAGASLRGRDLRHADASGAFLAKADLRQANLRDALLSGADLRRARLGQADLRNALLFAADLRAADLGYANLDGVRMPQVDLRGADLRRASLAGSLLGRADLRDADLSRADLQGASLDRADLRGSKLARANLAGADLAAARLDGAELRGARLDGARGLDQAQLEGACGDAHTRLPAGLRIAPCP